MPAGQACGVCGEPGHNRRTCPTDIADMIRSLDSDLDYIERSVPLHLERPRTSAQLLREHLTSLVDDRDEALVRAELAEAQAAALEGRMAELQAENAALAETNALLFRELSRLRRRASTVVEQMRAVG